MDEQIQEEYYVSDVNSRMRDLEDKTRLLRDRVVLIGQNLIESKESLDSSIKEIKSNIEAMKKDIEKMKEKMQIILEDMDSFSRREEVALIRKQFKMFEPLEFARIQDVERIVEEKMAEIFQSKEEKRRHSLEKDRRGYIF